MEQLATHTLTQNVSNGSLNMSLGFAAERSRMGTQR